MVGKLDPGLMAFERRIGLVPFSLLVGFLSIGLAMLYVTPRFEPLAHGVQFSSLSKHPFNFGESNALRFRILPPLIGFVTGLRGDRFVFVPLIFAVGLISSIYGVFRSKNFAPIAAFLVTSLVTFSAPTLIPLDTPGYTDSALYFFVFWTFALARKPRWSAVSFGLALLTHESASFLLPALILYSWSQNRGERKTVLRHAAFLLGAFVPLFLYRFWVSQYVDVAYDLAFYFSKSYLRTTYASVRPRFALGLFFLFKLLWLIPAFVVGKAFREHHDLFVVVFLAILLCDVAQLVFAYDVTRILCLGFPLLLISAEKLKQFWPTRRFTTAVLLVLLANFAIPQYSMTQVGLRPLRPFFLQ